MIKVITMFFGSIGKLKIKKHLNQVCKKSIHIFLILQVKQDKNCKMN